VFPASIHDRALDHGEGVRPGLEDVARSQSKDVSSQAFGEEVSVAIYRKSILTVPHSSIDVDAEALINQQIPMSHAGHEWLRLDCVSGTNQSNSHDGLIA
jgi:hypothetical protein